METPASYSGCGHASDSFGILKFSPLLYGLYSYLHGVVTINNWISWNMWHLRILILGHALINYVTSIIVLGMVQC